jgi:hypothetical protein
MANEVKTALDLFCSNMRQHHIVCLDEDDPRWVVYSVRVPAPGLDDAALIALGGDDEFGADRAAWLAARARRIAKSRGISSAPSGGDQRCLIDMRDGRAAVTGVVVTAAKCAGNRSRGRERYAAGIVITD